MNQYRSMRQNEDQNKQLFHINAYLTKGVKKKRKLYQPTSPGCSVSALLYAGHTLLLHELTIKTVTTNKTSITATFFILTIKKLSTKLRFSFEKQYLCQIIIC